MAALAMGIDVGSLTAKGILLADGVPAARFLSPAAPVARDSIENVARGLCATAGVARTDVAAVCLTGYGRFQAPFPALEKSEISCHGLGAFVVGSQVRTVIDIGGQDSKVVAIDGRGLVQDFAMNDKCAAGTGRALEVLARALGVSVERLGPLALEARSAHRLSSRCSLFMESDLLDARRAGIERTRLARGIVEAVVERVLALAARMRLDSSICLTGGVAKNAGVVRALEQRLGEPLTDLGFDPQLVGALGAAHFAGRSLAQ